MTHPLRILILEGQPSNAESMVFELRRAGFDPSWQCVSTEADYVNGLQTAPDLILADCQSPPFEGLRALLLLQKHGLAIPFIIVSGATGEDLAASIVNQGAIDALPKDRLGCLGPVVTHALQQKQAREEKRQAEEAGRRSEEFNRAIFNSLTAHIAVLDSQGTILSVNEAWKQFPSTNGCSILIATPIGANYLDVCRRACKEGLKEASRILDGLQRVLSGSLLDYRLEYPCYSSCHERWFLLTISPLAGVSRGAVVKYMDITARKQNERKRFSAHEEAMRARAEIESINQQLEEAICRAKELATSSECENQTKSMLLTAIPSILIGVDGADRITHWNPAAQRTFGITAAHILGRPFTESGIRWDWPTILTGIAECRKTGKLRRLEDVPFQRQDGVEGILSITLTPIQDEAGHRSGLLLVGNDITERKQAEEALRTSEAQIRALVGSLDDIIFEFDEAGTYINIWTNDESRLIWPKANVIGRRVTDILGEELARPFMEAFQRVMATGQAESMEYFLDVPAGRRWFLARISPIVSSDGSRRTVVMLARDITERKHLESQLAHSQKMESIGQLASGIAHEINTPTQYIGDNTRFLHNAFEDLRCVVETCQRLVAAGKLGCLTPALVSEMETSMEQTDVEYLLDEIPKALQQSLEGIARVTKIVQAMKEFSHPGTEEKVAVDLNRAIESTLTVARNEWKYVAEVHTDFDPALPMVPCLPGDFNQAILNIILNAAHAIADVVGEDSKQKGMITVSTRQKDDWVEIRIADTGTGIPEAVRPRIFDPFFTTKEVGKGTGQGLAIARSIIVDKHGGTLEFETDIGRGTTFIIRLPLVEHRARTLAA